MSIIRDSEIIRLLTRIESMHALQSDLINDLKRQFEESRKEHTRERANNPARLSLAERA